MNCLYGSNIYKLIAKFVNRLQGMKILLFAQSLDQFGVLILKETLINCFRPNPSCAGAYTPEAEEGAVVDEA